MIKRVNSTGRRRIPRSHVSIDIDDGNPAVFDAWIDLSGFEAPDDAAVVLEATCAGSNTVLRFEWGTIGSLSPPADRTLTGLNGEHVFFSLKVIDRSEKIGRILGLAENIRPLKGGKKATDGRRGLLPVQQTSLGEELWRLEFRSEDVFLLVNERIPGLNDRIRFDRSVYPLVYPAVIREVLQQAFDEDVDPSEDDEHWAALWLKFATRVHIDHTPPPLDESREEQQAWIDNVVTGFCQKHALRDQFVQAAAGKTAWDD